MHYVVSADNFTEKCLVQITYRMLRKCLWIDSRGVFSVNFKFHLSSDEFVSLEVRFIITHANNISLILVTC